MKTKGRGQWRVASGEKERRQPHNPRCVCVNAVDKGVSGRFGVKAVDKGFMVFGDCGNRFSAGEREGLRRGHCSAEPCFEIAAAVANLTRRSDQASWSRVRRGVRGANWSEGRLRCSWSEFLLGSVARSIRTSNSKLGLVRIDPV